MQKYKVQCRHTTWLHYVQNWSELVSLVNVSHFQTHGCDILQLFQDVFSLLPIATVIDGKILIVHGGISDQTDLEFLNTIERHKVTANSCQASGIKAYLAAIIGIWPAEVSKTYYIILYLYTLYLVAHFVTSGEN